VLLKNNKSKNNKKACRDHVILSMSAALIVVVMREC